MREEKQEYYLIIQIDGSVELETEPTTLKKAINELKEQFNQGIICYLSIEDSNSNIVYTEKVRIDTKELNR